MEGRGDSLTSGPKFKMFKLFKRKVTASECGKLGNLIKRERERAKYKVFHERMAKRSGTKIEWAE